VNAKLRAFLLFPPGLALLGALVAAPHIVHVLDTGSGTATVAQVAAGTLPTRNVTVTALARVDRGLRLSDRKSRSLEEKTSFFMPLSDPGAADGPTLVVVHTFYNEIFDAAERPDEPLQLEGTVRDVLWEGLESEVKEELAALHPLSPQVKLLELRGVPNGTDRLWSYGAPLFGLIIGLFLAANAGAPKQPPQPASKENA
jgi:hypothetical protein